MFDFNKIEPIKERITVEYILSRVSETDIFKYYFPNFSFSRKFKSPLRPDDDPSFGFFQGNKWVMAHDYSTQETWNVFEFVQALFNIDFNGALNKIAFDFRLAEIEVNANRLQLMKQDVSRQNKKEIKIKPRNFTKEDILYWNQYYITTEELELNNVYSVQYAYINKRLIAYYNSLRYAYLIYDDYVKLYSPDGPREKKWLSNVPNDIPYNIDVPYTSDTLIVTKSLKDKMVLSKIHTDVVGVQNESVHALRNMNDLFNKYNEVITFFDNDVAGIRAAKEVKDQYGFKYIHIPNDYSEKDPSDFVRSFGIDKLKQMFDNLIYKK